MITINIDGADTFVPTASTLSELVQDYDQTPVAIALNGKVVMRWAWANTRPKDGDTLQIVRAIGAG